MKYRSGFVSNSSSTAFMFANMSNRELTIVDFVHENGRELVDNWNKEYDYEDTFDDLLECAITYLDYDDEGIYTFHPGESRQLVFGDEDGTTLGRVFDYMLREGGTTLNWTWAFDEWRR